MGSGQLQADQDDLLQADLAVLDLADVLELGGQAGHTAAGGAGLPLEGAVVVTVLEAVSMLVLGGGGGQGGSGPGEDPGDDIAHIATFLSVADVVGDGGSTGVVLGHKKSFVVCLRPFDGAR